MATEDQIWALRLAVDEPDDSNGWSDEHLSSIIDASATTNAAASQVWLLKAAQYASLVDVSESGSSRKLGDLHKNALAMGAQFAAADGDAVAATSGPVVRRIRRGFGG